MGNFQQLSNIFSQEKLGLPEVSRKHKTRAKVLVAVRKAWDRYTEDRWSNLGTRQDGKGF